VIILSLEAGLKIKKINRYFDRLFSKFLIGVIPFSSSRLYFLSF